MRKLVFLSSVLCFVGCLVLLSTSANAAGYLVNTTFEPNSAGPGTWLGDKQWGAGDPCDPNNLPDSDSNNPDPICGVLWGGGDPNMARIATADAYAGTQAGMLKRLYGETGVATRLWFGNGENNRTLTMNWFQKYKDDGVTVSNQYVGVQIGDMSVGSGWADMALAVRMRGDRYGTWDIRVNAANPTEQVLLAAYDDDTYYEFDLVLDFQAKGYTVKVKKAGAASWEGEVSGDFRNSAKINSFDYILCKVAQPDAYGYWDNITVSAECRGWLPADLNADCYIDFKDFALFANEWMDCSHPDDPNCENYLEE